jgi:AP-4 complex subunit mu-1
MSISQLFILSRRGDSIIYRDFRRDIKKSNDIFFHNVNFIKEEEIAPPLFNIDGINFIYVKTDDLYIVISTLDNASPNYYLEVLDRIIKVIKDHIGILNEETIRKNFVLIYEIIDEMIDFGYPQLSDTEQVKEFVFTEPVI